MRAYTFTNFYLSSIQQGIQPAHALVDMFVKYDTESVQRHVLMDWAQNHRTMICLNGGNAASLQELIDRLTNLCSLLELPFQWFREDDQSLNGALTCVAVIVPEHIYSGAAALRQERPSDRPALIASRNWGDAELAMMELINSHNLAG